MNNYYSLQPTDNLFINSINFVDKIYSFNHFLEKNSLGGGGVEKYYCVREILKKNGKWFLSKKTHPNCILKNDS